MINWLTRIYNQGSLKIEAHNARVRDVLKEFRVKLEYYLYETYAHIIIDQFFTVIIGIYLLLWHLFRIKRLLYLILLIETLFLTYRLP